MRTIKKYATKILSLSIALICAFSLVGCAGGSGSSSVNTNKAESADVVKLDFVGTIDGKEFSGGSATDFIIEIGSNQLIDDFEDQLIGHKTGDKVDIKVTFPEDYGVEELNGKEATFATEIKTVYKAID